MMKKQIKHHLLLKMYLNLDHNQIRNNEIKKKETSKMFSHSIKAKNIIYFVTISISNKILELQID